MQLSVATPFSKSRGDTLHQVKPSQPESLASSEAAAASKAAEAMVAFKRSSDFFQAWWQVTGIFGGNQWCHAIQACEKKRIFVWFGFLRWFQDNSSRSPEVNFLAQDLEDSYGGVEGCSSFLLLACKDSYIYNCADKQCFFLFISLWLQVTLVDARPQPNKHWMHWLQLTSWRMWRAALLGRSDHWD